MSIVLDDLDLSIPSPTDLDRERPPKRVASEFEMFHATDLVSRSTLLALNGYLVGKVVVAKLGDPGWIVYLDDNHQPVLEQGRVEVVGSSLVTETAALVARLHNIRTGRFRAD